MAYGGQRTNGGFLRSLPPCLMAVASATIGRKPRVERAAEGFATGNGGSAGTPRFDHKGNLSARRRRNCGDHLAHQIARTRPEVNQPPNDRSRPLRLPGHGRPQILDINRVTNHSSVGQFSPKMRALPHHRPPEGRRSSRAAPAMPPTSSSRLWATTSAASSPG
jgi:hypothetical protein